MFIRKSCWTNGRVPRNLQWGLCATLGCCEDNGLVDPPDKKPSTLTGNVIQSVCLFKSLFSIGLCAELALEQTELLWMDLFITLTNGHQRRPFIENVMQLNCLSKSLCSWPTKETSVFCITDTGDLISERSGYLESASLFLCDSNSLVIFGIPSKIIIHSFRCKSRADRPFVQQIYKNLVVGTAAMLW